MQAKMNIIDDGESSLSRGPSAHQRSSRGSLSKASSILHKFHQEKHLISSRRVSGKPACKEEAAPARPSGLGAARNSADEQTIVIEDQID